MHPSEKKSNGVRSKGKINKKKEKRARKLDRNGASIREGGEGSPGHKDWEEIHKM